MKLKNIFLLLAMLADMVFSQTLAPANATITPAKDTVTAGSSAIFTVTAATGTAPFTYQWLFNGNVITPAQTGQSLSIPSATLANAGIYAAVVSNATGSVISSPAILTVKCAPLSIVVQPANQTVSAGSYVMFSVVASGTGPLTYQWAETFEALTTNINGATDSAYLTGATGAGDNGDQFFCVVTDACGNTVMSNVATLTVKLSPPVPVGLSAQNLTDTTVTLVWAPSTGATSYNIMISTVNNFYSVLVNTSGISATNYQIAGLTPGQIYFWKISAKNTIGTSDWSIIDNFTTANTAVHTTNHTAGMPFINIVKSDSKVIVCFGGYNEISATVYSTQGRIVTKLNPIQNTIIWNCRSVSNGMYLLEIQVGQKIIRQRIFMTK